MSENDFKPIVPAESTMPEMTLRAVLLGVLLAMLMAAANAYLGLKAGMTIAATYTTAVIGMAVIKALGGTILEENCARTVGSIGGNIAAGAIFTIPAFFIAGIWSPFSSPLHYGLTTLILAAGGILGIMFVTITRRILVSNAELPFPESIAAAEIHKAGQKGAGGVGHLLSGMGLGVLFTALTELKIVALKWQQAISLGKGSILLRGPEASAAFLGVGFIIGPNLAAINFSGGVLAWGLLAPAIAFFRHYGDLGAVTDWGAEIVFVWKTYVRYIAIGGMLVGAFYTLYRMRKSLVEGIARSVATLTRAGREDRAGVPRTDRDIELRWALPVIVGVALVMFVVFQIFTGRPVVAIVAALLVLVLGFVFAAVSGYLVGVIGVSSNPTSGLTVSVLIAVSFVLLLFGLGGTTGVAAVLCVAAFTCVSVSVAGEMMQDLKAGHIIGCTPWRMQLGDVFGVTAASVIMFLVLSVLHLGDIKDAVSTRLGALEAANTLQVEYTGDVASIRNGTYTLDEVRALPPETQNRVLGLAAGFGGDRIAAPQASLMAVVAKGIMERRTEWILIVVGIFMGLSFILMGIKSPMLVSVGMYLPVETSFAIFLGGLFKGVVDRWVEREAIPPEGKERIGNTGTLVASGLIAGEALIGILFAALKFFEIELPEVFPSPSYVASALLLLGLGTFLVIASKRGWSREGR